MATKFVTDKYGNTKKISDTADSTDNKDIRNLFEYKKNIRVSDRRSGTDTLIGLSAGKRRDIGKKHSILVVDNKVIAEDKPKEDKSEVEKIETENKSEVEKVETEETDEK